MKSVSVLGSGNIGILVAIFLANTSEYHVYLVDKIFSSKTMDELKDISNITLVTKDITQENDLNEVLVIYKSMAIISCLPYFLNLLVAKAAKNHDIHYFDLTEDVGVTRAIRDISHGANKAFVPQCGLAPGFIGIMAHSMALKFNKLDTIKMRVGALPIAPSNALKYSLTWSTDGVINEYGNLCSAIINGRVVELQPLEGFEMLTIDGDTYECFNTSGGLGTLTETYHNKVQNLTYKTIRYPGHCQIVRLLMNDLKLNENRNTLKEIIENAIPKTLHDVIVIDISVVGIKDNIYTEENYTKKIYGQSIYNKQYTAIQSTTASGVCAVVNKVLTNSKNYKGFIKQEDFTITDILESPFGFCYA